MNGSRAKDEREPFDIVAALLEHPEDIISDLHEEISRLASALIDARLQLESTTNSTRQDVALDLYDEELITKRDVIETGGLKREDFFDKLIERRQLRLRLKNA